MAQRREAGRALGAARAFTIGGVQPAGHIGKRLVADARQLRQHRCGVDLQRAAHRQCQRPHESGVGQIVVAIGLERLELALRNLDRRGQRGDVHALALARRTQLRAGTAGGGRRRTRLTH
jgi:hypothetical protein